MGLFRDKLRARRMRDPVRGQAQVVDSGRWGAPATWQNCRMQLVVTADGLPATHVQHNDVVPGDKLPTVGSTLPVTVDRADPRRVKILWDEVESSGGDGAREAEELAAAMRGRHGPGADRPPMGGG
jgi:hypothetical protein